MWVGGNEDIAKNAVGAVLDHLENNELLNIDGELKGETPIDVRVIHNGIEVFN